jgi:hypothetical protein
VYSSGGRLGIREVFSDVLNLTVELFLRADAYRFLREGGVDNDTERRPAGFAAAKRFRQRSQGISNNAVNRGAANREILECTRAVARSTEMIGFRKRYRSYIDGISVRSCDRLNCKLVGWPCSGDKS